MANTEVTQIKQKEEPAETLNEIPREQSLNLSGIEVMNFTKSPKVTV